MIRFATTTLIITTLLILSLTGWLSWWIFGAGAIGYSVLLIYASACIQSGFYVKATCHLSVNQPVVALTFDDGPAPVQTPIILDLLKEAGFKATFFCIGEKIKQHPQLAQRIVNEGHAIGNHTFKHSNLFPLSMPSTIKKELIDTQSIIDNIDPKNHRLFRPPYGVTNPLIYFGLRGLNLKVTGWNCRSLDTTKRNEDQVLHCITRNLKAGDIILLHDTSKNVIGVLKQLIPHLKDNNLTSISLQ
jgi:peptidoglycan/xylan/chitin deacetylase (PgdA/CDA1 family)